MTTETLETRTIELSSFDRAIFTGYGELTLVQGDRESITIETHPDTLPRIKAEVVNGTLHVGQGRTLGDKIGFALQTSLTRKEIRYTLTLRNLASLELGGVFVASAGPLVTDALTLKLTGPSRLTVDGLTARSLHADMLSAGMVAVSGEVDEQRIVLGGPSDYDAPRLKSRKASIEVKGPGNAKVWAADELDVTVRGIGNVAYYGSPKIRQRIAGIGSLARLGESPR